MEQLEQEQDRLVHGPSPGRAVVFARLRDGAEQAPSLQDHFAAVNQELHAMTQMDASLVPLRDRAFDLQTGLRIFCGLWINMRWLWRVILEQLDRIRERLEQLKRLQRRHGLDLAGLITRRDELREQLM